MWTNVKKTKALYADMKGKCQQKFLWTKGFLAKMQSFTEAKYPQADSVIGQRTKVSKQYNVITSKRRIFSKY